VQGANEKLESPNGKMEGMASIIALSEELFGDSGGWRCHSNATVPHFVRLPHLLLGGETNGNV
jgi:hypothetical protein